MSQLAIRTEFTPAEILQYENRKERIRSGLKSALDVADDLIAIRRDPKKPWRLDGYGTWKEFLQHEYGISDSRARQVMKAAKTIKAAPSIEGVSESALRPLAKLSPEGQRKIVEQAKRLTGKTTGQLTEKDTKRARRELAMEATSLAAEDRRKAAADAKRDDKATSDAEARQAKRDKHIKHWQDWPAKCERDIEAGLAIGLDPADSAYGWRRLYNYLREKLGGKG